MSRCQHLLRDTGPVSAGLPESRRGRAVCAMVTGPGGGGGAAELRPSAAAQQLMSVIDFAGCGPVTAAPPPTPFYTTPPRHSSS